MRNTLLTKKVARAGVQSVAIPSCGAHWRAKKALRALYAPSFVLLAALNSFATNWYIDCNATDGANNGANWANAWTKFGTHLQGGSVQPGDTVWVSGGNYAESVVIDQGGTSSKPITIRASQEVGHSGLVWVGKFVGYSSAQYITIDGSKRDSFEAGVTNVLNLRAITNNIGIRVGELVSTNAEAVIWTSGAAGVKLRWLEVRMNSKDPIGAYAVALHRDTGVTYTNGELAYCWIHQCPSTGINMNNGAQVPSAWGVFQIHHCIVEDYGDAGIDIGGSVDVHHCIIGQNWCVNGHPGQFRCADPTRIYNCVLYDTYGGDPVIYTSPQKPDTGYSFFYGNLIYNEAGWGATNTGGTAISLAVNEVVFGADGGRMTSNAMPQMWTNVYIFNNTVICSNGMANAMSMWNRHGPSDLDAPTGGVYIVEAKTFNNVFDNGSVGFRGPSVWGWYAATGNMVDFNALKGIGYNDGDYTPDQFNAAYPTMSHNTNAIPGFLNRAAYDFRLVSPFPGANLSSFTNMLPGLDVDLAGVSRGAGAWDRGAFAYVYSKSDASLILRYTFDDLGAGGAGAKVTDVSGTGSDLMFFGFPSTPTNWPTRVAYTNGLGYAAQFIPGTNNIPSYDNFRMGQFGGITNVGAFTNLTAITVCVWMKYFPPPYEGWDGSATIIDVCYGTNGCTWSLGRNYAYQTSFSIFTNLDYNTDHDLHLNYPDNQSVDWHFYAATFNCTNQVMKGYFDGTNFVTYDLTGYSAALTNLTVGRPSSGGTYPGDHGWIAVGCRTHAGSPALADGDGFPNNAWMDGQVFDLRVYSRVLSPSEILMLYLDASQRASGLAPPRSLHVLDAGR